jgi:hypothetical protein
MRYRVLAGCAAAVASVLILGIGFRAAQSLGAGTFSPPSPPAGWAAAIPVPAPLESDMSLPSEERPQSLTRSKDYNWRNASVVLSVEADYWRNTSAKWNDMKTNNDVGIGRFKLVRPCWGVFTMTKMSAAALRANPAPFQ